MDGSQTSGVDVVWALCERLRSEKLLLNSEMETLVQLHKDISECLAALGVLEWSSQQHQLVLHRLLNSHPCVLPESASKIISKISDIGWVDAYRRLDHHCSNFEGVLNLLFSAPRTVAELLNAVDQLHQEDIVSEEVVRSVFSLVYGHALFPNDERLTLIVLQSLIELQVATHADPRRLLRRGNSAFCRLYKLFTDGLFAAKIFLTAALHDAVMHVLCQEDIFLDIDPTKSPLRYPVQERARRFGTDPHSAQYQKKMASHRKVIIEKLILLVIHFVKGISDSLTCFPASLTWLVQKMHHMLISKGASKEQASLICTDLIITNLLCPAITNPENIGVVSDTPVGHIARFNLMQIGQIVQMLALSKYESPPAYMVLFANQFKDNQICDIVPMLLARRLPNLNNLFPTQLSESNKNEEFFRRTHFLGSVFEVNSLLTVFKSSAIDELSNADHTKDIKNYVRRMPPAFYSPEAVQDSKVDNNERRSKLQQLTEKVSRGKLTPQGSATDIAGMNNISSSTLPPEYFDIVVFRKYDEDGERLGLQPEDKFIENMRHKNAHSKKMSDEEKEKRTRFLETGSTVESAISECTTDPGGSDLEDGDQEEVASLSSSIDPPQEDRLLMLDEDGSSTLPDNLSDVGGMSGRGSPSLSGRETPLSQAGHRGNNGHNAEDREETEAEVAAASTAAGDTGDPARRTLPPLPVTVRKSNAEGLEEKFGKFSLPPSQQGNHYRDDQRSLLSDSWSTDVVPSDNEGPAGILLVGGLPLLPPGDNLMPGGARQQRGAVARSGSVGNQGLAAAEDRSDTWSLDAIASDSEADPARDADRDNVLHPNVQVRQPVHPINVPVDNLLDLDPVVPPADASMSRRISGSSFMSRSDVDSEMSNRETDGTADLVGSVPRPVKPPVIPPRNGSLERPSSSGAALGSPIRQSSGERPGTSGSSVSATPPGPPGLRGKKSALFQGLRNVSDRIGDKMRKGISSSTLRPSIPHSSTISDLIGSLPEWSSNGMNDRRGSEPRITASESHPANLSQAGALTSADDILNKYKRKPSVVLVDVGDQPPVELAPPAPPLEPDTTPPYYDADNLSQCRAFVDAKRKLRHVLSNIGSIPAVVTTDKRSPLSDDQSSERTQLNRLLKLLLAEAINSREQVLSSHIREVIRVLACFDDRGIKKLLRTLKDEHRKRTSYVLYLQQSRLTLLRLLSHINKLSQRVERERSLTRECLVEVLVRYYLDNHDHVLKRLLQEFGQLKAQDEKTDLLSRTLKGMCHRLEENVMWKDANKEMLEYAFKCVERVVMAPIHGLAFFPNGEADMYRDDVLHRSLARLARTITPDHPMLKIPKILHGEAPWPSAQAEIEILNAFKSARDKLQCVVRMCTTISNLIALAPGAGPAAADDVTPVVVYVLIQANPPALLSNVQYVQGFCEAELSGADLYWWTQFTAAIEFIKTLL